MTLDEFKKNAAASEQPPKDLGLPLQALWWDVKDDWHKAHEAAQEEPGPNGSWVHAYLHRKEGDASNAAYWYRNAGKPVFAGTLEAESDQIAAALLEKS